MRGIGNRPENKISGFSSSGIYIKTKQRKAFLIHLAVIYKHVLFYTANGVSGRAAETGFSLLGTPVLHHSYYIELFINMGTTVKYT